MGTTLHFYDSATPRNIPSGVYIAAYVNGDYAWTHDDYQRMRGGFIVSVESAASWAKYARCIDVESGAAGVGDVVPFVTERRRLGFDDVTVYVNRSNWQACKDAISAAKIDEPLWWVSTLDGTQDIDGAWAVQYNGGMRAAYDLSILRGVDNLHAF